MNKRVIIQLMGAILLSILIDCQLMPSVYTSSAQALIRLVLTSTLTSILTSYNFAMEHFRTTDHFILNERLFRNAVLSVKVDHKLDNLSDHDPLIITFDLDISLSNMVNHNYRQKFVWYKATVKEIDAYKKKLTDTLSGRNLLIDNLTYLKLMM